MIEQKGLIDKQYQLQENPWGLLKFSLVAFLVLLWTSYFSNYLHFYFAILLSAGSWLCVVAISFYEANRNTEEEQKRRIRLELMNFPPEKLMDEIKIQRKNDADRLIIVEYLNALSCMFSERRKMYGNIELICQEAVYSVLSLSAKDSEDYDNDDWIMCAAISLLAIIAQEESVRHRTFIQCPEKYGPQIPIQIMRRSLRRTQSILTPVRKEELLAAELQRKSCLFLGAMINGVNDKNKEEIAIKISIDSEGLKAILEAMDWFRCHTQVIHWALWAIFNLSYENRIIQKEFIRLGGISRLCRSLELMPKEREIVRHSIAILFDLLRKDENGSNDHDVFRLRTLAIQSGIHNSIYNAVVYHTTCPDIYVMGQQILKGTGYHGNPLPGFVQTP